MTIDINAIMGLAASLPNAFGGSRLETSEDTPIVAIKNVTINEPFLMDITVSCYARCSHHGSFGTNSRCTRVAENLKIKGN